MPLRNDRYRDAVGSNPFAGVIDNLGHEVNLSRFCRGLQTNG
jgi:hypothetical protein